MAGAKSRHSGYFKNDSGDDDGGGGGDDDKGDYGSSQFHVPKQ
jgi:hypothetical protein